MSLPVETDVTGAVRGALLSGEYLPRQHLIEADLCERFGAGPADVRSALRLLAVEGLIAARTTERVGRAQAEQLRGIGASMARAVADGELMTYSDLNARLHRCVRDIAGHETADQVLERLRAQVVRHQSVLSLMPGRARVSLPQHQRIIEAIIAKDPTAAEAAMRDHGATAVEALRMLEAGRHRAS
ncbi:FCD domain-containing protein [Streptomyces sp. HP-A2021]|uniref:GntR family transcriptional regulator n=1 Tax=Streptomyces sp. HP-A2021 TaxID=2927875 RepID=UPI001FAFBEAD|nr:FCD domain-containing protein [Streptomyces sp. HP-A2021]UOB07996.1 FCD domain-containing protein [Streptomyces sp. HP-A2021]